MLPQFELNPRRTSTLAAYNCPDCSFDAVHRITAQNIARDSIITLPGADGFEPSNPNARVRNLFFYDRCLSCGFGQLTGRPGAPGNPDAGDWGVIATVHNWAQFPKDKKTLWMQAFNHVLDQVVKREQKDTT